MISIRRMWLMEPWGIKRTKNYSVKPAFRISMANHFIWIPIFGDTVVERKKSIIGIL